MNEGILQQLIENRRELHQNPETSDKEIGTAVRIVNWLKRYHPDEIINGLGGHGIAAIYKGKSRGPVLMFRAELDALPIKETNTFHHRSNINEAAHLCGHDGHMVFLLGMAEYLKTKPPDKGKVVLLFQPAEETGAGAERVIIDDAFQKMQPDFVFAIHNLPGFNTHQIIVSDSNFAAASTGIIIKLNGRTSHAAEPEKGRSPAQAVARIIQALESLPASIDNLRSYSLVTIIHVKIGSVAFGTTPGKAVVMATLRAYEDEDLKTLSLRTEEIASGIANSEGLDLEISYTESFPATINHPDASAMVIDAAGEMKLDIFKISEPFKWTEDFGHFTSRFKAALIGLGSGEKHPALHNPDYDFPDEIIPTGVELFKQIYNRFRI